MGFPRLTRRKDAEDYKEPQEFLISFTLMLRISAKHAMRPFRRWYYILASLAHIEWQYTMLWYIYQLDIAAIRALDVCFCHFLIIITILLFK